MVEEYYRPTREERKEVTLGIRAAVGIRNGAQCTNHAQDQQHVIFLLNQIPTTSGGALDPTGPTGFRAPRDGYCDPGLSALIRRFQQQNGLQADGVVDPDGPTLKALNNLAATKGAAKKAAGATLTPQQLATLHGILDRCHGLLESASFRSGIMRAAPEFPNLVRDIESEMRKQGLPLGQRKVATAGPLPAAALGRLPPGMRLPLAGFPIARTRDLVLLIEALEIILVLVGAIVVLGVLYYLLRKLWRATKALLAAVLKAAVDVLAELNTAVRKAQLDLKNNNRCRDDAYDAYFNASRAFQRILESQTGNATFIRQAARAFWSALKALLECSGAASASVILAILGGSIAGFETFMEFLLFWVL